jgi:hypothetical protein
MTYTITPSATSYNEGDEVTITVTTTNVPDGTVLNWYAQSLVGPTGFDFSNPGGPTANSGSVTINSNTGTFKFTLVNDGVGEGTETFTVRLEQLLPDPNNPSNPPYIAILKTSGPITINEVVTTTTTTAGPTTTTTTATPILPLQAQTFSWLSGITFYVVDETIANIGFDFLESGLLQIVGWQQPDVGGPFAGPGAINLVNPAYAKWYDGPLPNPGTGGQYYIKYRINSEIGFVGKGSSVTSGTWIAIDDDPPGTTVTRTLVSGGTITETRSNHYINVIASTGFAGFTGGGTAIVNMDIDVGQMVGGSITLIRTIPNVTLHAVAGASAPSYNIFLGS